MIEVDMEMIEVFLTLSSMFCPKKMHLPIPLVYNRLRCTPLLNEPDSIGSGNAMAYVLLNGSERKLKQCAYVLPSYSRLSSMNRVYQSFL